MSIGVAIVTYDSAKTIERCIESVRAAGGMRISIVDSASSDITVEKIIRTHEEVLRLSNNKGFAHAANIAASSLDTDYVLFLNPDAVLVPGALEKLLTGIEKSVGVGIVGALLVDHSGFPEKDSYGKSPTLWNIFTRHLARKNIPNEALGVDWVSGGALLIRKSVFLAVGGFDEGFFMYWEDIDLCKRVRDGGFSVYIEPEAQVVHDRGASSSNQSEKTRLYDASANRYFQKHFPPYIWYLQYLLRSIYRLLRPLAR